MTGPRAQFKAGEYIAWLAIRDQTQSVIDDVERIRSHPLIPRTIPIHGYINDVHTGKLIEVESARPLGKAA